MPVRAGHRDTSQTSTRVTSQHECRFLAGEGKSEARTLTTYGENQEALVCLGLGATLTHFLR